MTNQGFITYQDVRDHKIIAELFLKEIPETNAASFAVPSMRLGEPAFVQFSSPAHRAPRKPVLQASPDRWWAVHARTGTLIYYSLCKVQPFYQGEPWPPQELTRLELNMEAYQEKMLALEGLVDALAPSFFLGQAEPAPQRYALWQLFDALIPVQLKDQYQQLAPDFFTWLIRS